MIDRLISWAEAPPILTASATAAIALFTGILIGFRLLWVEDAEVAETPVSAPDNHSGIIRKCIGAALDRRCRLCSGVLPAYISGLKR